MQIDPRRIAAYLREVATRLDNDRPVEPDVQFHLRAAARKLEPTADPATDGEEGPEAFLSDAKCPKCAAQEHDIPISSLGQGAWVFCPEHTSHPAAPDRTGREERDDG